MMGMKKKTSSPNAHLAPCSTMPGRIMRQPNKASMRNRPNTPEETGRCVKRTMSSETPHTAPMMASCKAV